VKSGCCHTRRIRSTAGWLVPAAILALLPKCPLCFVAYFAMLTGFGLSVAVAAHIRMLLAVTCIVCLGAGARAVLARGLFHRHISSRREFSAQ
jgi:Ca2+/Na+ antiporter